MYDKPLFFNHIYKSTLWGHELWELSDNENGVTNICNYDNLTLVDLFNNKELKEKIFGTKCTNLDNFPVLIKFIEANKDLSIQVHPNDEYAKIHENNRGKNEVWYVIDCNPDTNIIYGLNDKAKDISNKDIVNNITDYLNYQKINNNDLISIPSGTIHAILSGTKICEIQQNSDITYRIYDWDRVDSEGNKRMLHKDKAIDVINKDAERKVIHCESIDDDNLYSTNSFSIDMMNINNKKDLISNPDTFTIYIVISGKGKIKTNNYEEEIKEGSTFLIPSSLGEYELIGNIKVLKVYM